MRAGDRPGDSRRLLCSMRRWQYSKALSRSRSGGGSRRLEEEAADSTDRVEPSSSDLSSEERTRAHKGTGAAPSSEGAETATTADPRPGPWGFPGRPPDALSAVRFVLGQFAEEKDFSKGVWVPSLTCALREHLRWCQRGSA